MRSCARLAQADRGTNSGQQQSGAGGTQSSSGGTTTSVQTTGGTPTGGIASATGGTAAPVTTSATGGTTIPATTAAAGGTAAPVTAASGGNTIPVTTSSGGAPAVGGSARLGGTTALGGIAASGGTAAGGTTGTAGSTSTGAAGAAGAPAPGSIPAGYPTPTADNYAKCKSSTASGGLCPGGGAGPACIECHFGGEAGNYAVSVTLGGAAASQTYVSAEANRGLLKPVTLAAGKSQTYAFVVNVRTKESEPAQAVSAGTPGLDMYFSGPTATPPAVSAIGYALVTAATKPIMVWIAGDSTTCDQPGSGFGGWGQMFPENFNAPIGIANYADSGESSSSFYGSSLLCGAIKSQWSAGDWVFIQFGHNDKGVADATVQTNLEKYVADAQAAKVNAILVSPPARVGSIPVGDQSSLHAVSASGAAKDKSVPFVDLTALSTAWYNGLGLDVTAVKAKYHAGGTDVTHTNIAGAEGLADPVAAEVKKQNIAGLVEYMR
jgi:lysophospholipase L1-like esterase